MGLATAVFQSGVVVEVGGADPDNVAPPGPEDVVVVALVRLLLCLGPDGFFTPVGWRMHGQDSERLTTVEKARNLSITSTLHFLQSVFALLGCLDHDFGRFGLVFSKVGQDRTHISS